MGRTYAPLRFVALVSVPPLAGSLIVKMHAWLGKAPWPLWHIE